MVRNANEKSESAKASEQVASEASNELPAQEQQPQDDSKEHQEQQPLKEPLAEVDKAQRLHCINLQMVYFRAFVFSTFKALVLHHPIHSYDVTTAIDNCEETIVEVHFTDFLLKTCNHVQQDLKSKYQDDEIENGLKMSLVKATKSCFEMDSNHVTIKKKFVEILNKTFQLVPHSNDLYYYHPGSHRQHSLGTSFENLNVTKGEKIWRKNLTIFFFFFKIILKKHFWAKIMSIFILFLGDDIFPVPSRMRKDTRDADTEDDYKLVEEALDKASKNNSKNAGGVNNNDKASSMISEMISAATSVSDLNESRDFHELVDFEPFFLQVSITIRYGKEMMITTPIVNLPTCLIDLLKTMNNVEEIDLARFSVSLDLLSISLTKQDSPLPIGGQRQKGKDKEAAAAGGLDRSFSLCSNLSITQHQPR